MTDDDEVRTLVDLALLEASLRLAAEDVEECDRFVALATDLGPRRVGRALTALRRIARAARRDLERAESLLRRLAEDAVALGDADALTDAERRKLQRRTDRAVGRLSMLLGDHQLHLIDAARLAAGIAALHEPVDPRGEPLWDEAREVLAYEDLGDCPERAFEVPDHPALEAWLAGVVAHLAGQSPAYAVICVEGSANRYVQVATDPTDPVRVESVGDHHLGPDERLSADERAELERLGFLAPDGDRSPNWWVDAAMSSATELGKLLAAALVAVHGVGPGSRLALSVGRWPDDDAATDHAARGDADHPVAPHLLADPVLLQPAAPTVTALADALAVRLAGFAALVGDDGLEVAIRQGPTTVGSSACLEVAAAEVVARLDAPSTSDRDRLVELGWSPVGDGVVERRWSRDDLDAACWHTVAALVAVHGVMPHLPVATATTFAA